MNKDRKRVINDIDSSSIKRIRLNVTCLLDLPNEIFLLICRYLSPSDVLYWFYTPLKGDFRLHNIISDYYTKIKFDKIRYFNSIYTNIQ